MENASKALLIAGAILLAILIISLGIIVYNQADGATSNLNLSEYEIQTFNKKFSRYEGGSISGSQANNLIQAVMASNAANAKDETGMYICLFYPPAGADRGGATVHNWKYTWAGVADEGNGPELFYGTSHFGDIATVVGHAVYRGHNEENLKFNGEIKIKYNLDTNIRNRSTEPVYSLKVRNGISYKVMMNKNPKTGLIGNIMIGDPTDPNIP